ncbi:MAG: hypothetical protein WAJ88_12895, partial [Pseudolabrys sp.]
MAEKTETTQKARELRTFLVSNLCIAVSVHDRARNSPPVSACKISVPGNGETRSTDWVEGIQFDPFQLHHQVFVLAEETETTQKARELRTFLVSN